MNLYTIDTGFFKLDGGAMFGVVPKTLWQRINPPDEKNLCTWTMRCLLVEEGDRLILIDTGLGNKQSEKFFSFYEPHGDDTIDSSLKKHGFSRDDITDVFLTHLHFDHCGGAVERDGNGMLKPAFQNAVYWSHRDHWNWAINPNPREKASFLSENILPMEESGQLNFISENEDLIPGFGIRAVHGHTEAMMLPQISYKGKTIVYMADLMPSTGHIHVPFVMAYDVRPLDTLKEKSAFLKEAYDNNYILYFEHDKSIECCNLQMTDRGYRLHETFNLIDI